ncbi:MAG: transporter [Verrucomicrobiae bacterium]|nr:transporter [Verrucomicrobiae bacterium]
MSAQKRSSSLAQLFALALGAFAMCPVLQAQHYPVGVEGILGGSVPPPGVYVKDYNYIYWSDLYKNGPSDFSAFAYVNAVRPIWITELKILGANYGMDALVPFGYKDIEIDNFGLNDEHFGLGDVYFEPILLAWHWKHVDLAVGYSFWAPAGNYDEKEPATLGTGAWGHMFTVGATWFPWEDKSWAVTVLNRYEINQENDDTEVTLGNTYSLEWGISKALNKTFIVGVAGYAQLQVTNDRGNGVTGDPDARPSVFGIGPEVQVVLPAGFFLSVRYAKEFATENRPEGNAACLTVTKAF